MKQICQLFHGDPSIILPPSPTPTSFICCSEPQSLQKLIHQMPNKGNMFSILIDSRVTTNVTHIKEDIQGNIILSPFHHMHLSKSLNILGRGTVQWFVDLNNSKPKAIKTQAYYVPSVSQCLLSTQYYF